MSPADPKKAEGEILPSRFPHGFSTKFTKKEVGSDARRHLSGQEGFSTLSDSVGEDENVRKETFEPDVLGKLWGGGLC